MEQKIFDKYKKSGLNEDELRHQISKTFLMLLMAETYHNDMIDYLKSFGLSSNFTDEFKHLKRNMERITKELGSMCQKDETKMNVFSDIDKVSEMLDAFFNPKSKQVIIRFSDGGEKEIND